MKRQVALAALLPPADGDQIADGSALPIRKRLELLVVLPVGGEGIRCRQQLAQGCPGEGAALAHAIKGCSGCWDRDKNRRQSEQDDFKETLGATPRLLARTFLCLAFVDETGDLCITAEG